MKRFFAFAVLLSLVGSGRAQLHEAVLLPGVPARELTVQSDTVVLAAPAGPTTPGQFRALRVLFGSGLKEGDHFEIDGLSSYDLTIPNTEGGTGKKAARAAEVLLFLGPPNSDASSLRRPLVPSGLRLLTAEGTAYYPKNYQAHDDYFLAPYREDVRWDDLMRKVAADAAEVNHVRSLKGIANPHHRNEALMDWVERHRREFGAGLNMDDGAEPTYGWGSLEQDVFKWILESRIPADCWAAVKLYAELNHGWNPWLESPTFGTRAGRAFLLAIALDEEALSGHRARAVWLLSLGQTLWPTKVEGHPDVEPLSEMEQIPLIDHLIPLLKSPDSSMRVAASNALLKASSPRADGLKQFRTRRALPALTATYQAQTPGEVHDALAEAVAIVGGPQYWQELTGNAHGVVAVLQGPISRQGADATCSIVWRQAEEIIQAAPTLLLERLDDKGKAVEKKEKPLTELTFWPAHTPATDDDNPYDAVYYKRFALSMDDFTPGLWRMTVKGVAGDDKAPWTSEPRLLRLSAPPQPGQPNTDPKAPRIVFDP